MSLEIVLTPAGHLLVETSVEAEPKLNEERVARLQASFGASSAHGLELLAGEFLDQALPPTVHFWREFARRYFTRLCHTPGLQEGAGLTVPPPGAEELSGLVESAPPMKGLEYLNGTVLSRLWGELEERVTGEINRAAGGAQAYLKAKNPVWNVVGRVTFHLAENKRNVEHPFAFLATYAHKLSEQGKVQHLPLGRALQEYSGTQNRAVLTTLLSPVQRAAEKSKVARELLDSRAIFHPQAWSPAQAYRLLKEIPQLEQSGVLVRIPDWWRAGRPPRPQVSIRIGERAPSLMGKEGLLDFKVEKALDGQELTEEEWQTILKSTDGLVLLKGKWVEVDRERLNQVLDHWKKVQSEAGPDGVSFLQGMRLISGFGSENAQDGTGTVERREWSSVMAGDWLKKILEQMEGQGTTAESDPGRELQAELRPYQRQGVHWLWFMNKLGLGACLADDMGLGKTIQVISLLLALKRQKKTPDQPATSLLAVPASLIANWKAEIRRFAPSLSVFFAHPSETSADALSSIAAGGGESLAGYDLVITSYALLLRQAWLKELNWNLVVLDEAQAIKNPSARQTRRAKELRGRCRIALTGTPIENRLSDLWSLFDFLNPGLLGGSKEFSSFVKGRPGADQQPFAPLRRLVRPYILRRLKTDKRIISDLPDKTELDTFCPLSRQQAVLYHQAVRELEEKLESPETQGIQRRGIVLAFLTRFKQICNHPSQWLGDGVYQSEQSGKFGRLRELAEEIGSRQERMLVFTQYREMTDPLASYLTGIFGRSGLVLHGDTAVGKRKQLVDDFQRDDGPPFFVLSLKAGGTGLNLTAASHVIHFDRWWNPAVENQATDRAFRIGQRQNVLVHKFICRGTLEERIHELILSKRSLSDDILGEGAEHLLTEMSNSELLRFVSLDIKTVTDE